VSGFQQAGSEVIDATGANAYLRKYDISGNLVWSRQAGSNGNDYSGSVSVDGLGNVYISGNRDGSLGGSNAGGRDAFVSKYNAAGAMLWTRQYGTSEDDLSFGVSADHLGNVFMTGYT